MENFIRPRSVYRYGPKEKPGRLLQLCGDKGRIVGWET